MLNEFVPFFPYQSILECSHSFIFPELKHLDELLKIEACGCAQIATGNSLDLWFLPIKSLSIIDPVLNRVHFVIAGLYYYLFECWYIYMKCNIKTGCIKNFCNGVFHSWFIEITEPNRIRFFYINFIP